MPLRFVRSKVSGIVDPLQIAISATVLAKDLLSTLQFPPATAAVSVVLLILETVQSIQTNKAGCIALARRAVQILVEIDHHMRGRWDSAPQRLVQNLLKFEGTLKLVYTFMKKLADSKWSDRVLRRNSIEDALAEYTRLIDDAAQSFQLATLIDLHYTIDTLSPGNTVVQVAAQSCVEDPPPYVKKKTQDGSAQEHEIAESSLTTILGVPEPTHPPAESSFPSPCKEPITEIATDGVRAALNDHYLPEGLSLPTLDDNHGFRRYHQSEIKLRGRSCCKEHWWAGATEVQVQGQPVLIKRYDDTKARAFRQWLREVKMLQNLHHPNLPQMLGLSDDETPTPFILLSNVRTQSPEAIVRETLRTASLATCMELLLRFYRDLADTALYIQRQLNLTDSQVQDFLEAAGFRVDSQKTLVVGLPPPREGKWYSARNYGLAHTLLNACLQMLPNRGRVTYSYDSRDEEVTEEMQKKINHLVTLAQSLLPGGDEAPRLPSRPEKLLEDNVGAPLLTLRQVRDLTFHVGTHEHSWSERNVPACKFDVGDLGYVPRGKDWSSFVRLGNVLECDAQALRVRFKASGEHWCWENVPIRRQPLRAFDMPMNVSGWPVAVPPYKQIDVVVIHEAFVACVKDAWKYLLENAKKAAQNARIKPEDVVLVTHAGTHQDFSIRDCRPPPLGTNQYTKVTDPRSAANSSARQLMYQPKKRPPSFASHLQLHPPAIPSVVYLFTALSPSHEPRWSSSPVSGGDCPPPDRHLVYKIGYKSGFLKYVQLHAEDFEG